MHQSEFTGNVERLLDRLRAGDPSARGELINATVDRLRHWTGQFKRDHRNHPLAQTEDVFQNAVLALREALEQVEPNDAQHYFRLAAKKIRQSLLDLSRQLTSAKYQQRHLESLVHQGGSDDGRDMIHEPTDPDTESRSGELHVMRLVDGRSLEAANYKPKWKLLGINKQYVRAGRVSLVKIQ